MKKLLKSAAGALLCLSMVFTVLSCQVEEEQYKWEGTKLVVSAWPEHVSYIKLVPDTSKKRLNLSAAGSQMTDEYFTGTAALIIDYDRLEDDREYDNYFGYGIRSDSEKPLKVFINGVEVDNENPAATRILYGEERNLNVSVGCFRTSFNITGMKTVELSFENAPEKIKNRDLRLADNFQWTYIDKDDLYEGFKTVNVFRKNSNDNWVECERLGRNGLYLFDAYGQNFSVDYTVKEGYYSTVDDARFTVSGVDAELTVKDFPSLPGTLFSCKVYVGVRVPDGTIIKLSGGTVTPYDTTNFSNKSLAFEANASGSTEVTSASLSLKDDSVIGKTFALSIDGTELTGTWFGKSIFAAEDARIVLYIDGNDINYNPPDYELLYYSNGLNSTTGPCWHLRTYSSDSDYYSFILKEASV